MHETVIPVDVDGRTVLMTAIVRGGEEEVAGRGLPSFDDVQQDIEHIAKAVTNALRNVSPDKTTVELGFEVALEAGQLTALLVNGSANASLKVTLEWDKASASAG
jgi:Trypsin-co-occurring domain 1